MSEEPPPLKDRWAKLESASKAAAALCAAIGALLIPYVINRYTEQNRNTQIYMQIMTEREKADTDIRAKMFERLIVNYLGEFKEYANKDDEQALRKQIMILDLVSRNFQEFFNMKPLFEEVYRRLMQKRGESKDNHIWVELEDEITRVSKNIASRQAIMLNTIGKTVHLSMQQGRLYCIRLYSQDDLKTVKLQGTPSQTENYISGPCIPQESKDTEVAAQDLEGYVHLRSIEIYLKTLALTRNSTIVQVTPYDDYFKNREYKFSRAGTGFEFEVSYFDYPYMDNIKLPDGSRFSLLLKDIYRDIEEKDIAEMQAIRFKNEFTSLRDRPLFEDMLEKLRQN